MLDRERTATFSARENKWNNRLPFIIVPVEVFYHRRIRKEMHKSIKFKSYNVILNNKLRYKLYEIKKRCKN
jgi:hypothetical protein